MEKKIESSRQPWLSCCSFLTFFIGLVLYLWVKDCPTLMLWEWSPRLKRIPWPEKSTPSYRWTTIYIRFVARNLKIWIIKDAIDQMQIHFLKHFNLLSGVFRYIHCFKVVLDTVVNVLPEISISTRCCHFQLFIFHPRWQFSLCLFSRVDRLLKNDLHSNQNISWAAEFWKQ